MKRYSMHTGSPRKPLASMVKHPCGEYVKLADVEREYIPRPDPEEARKERPILFNGEMVRAILECRKTMTRRVVTVPWHKGKRCVPYAPYYEDYDGVLMVCDEYGDWHNYQDVTPCPLGIPGDRLWVRETWAKPYINIAPVFRADYSGAGILKWRPSIHMPRWASRITLEITDVMVERLCEISIEDIRKEGIRGDYYPDCAAEDPHSAAIYYRELWDSIYGKKHPWESNPWVFVISFNKLV